jgi:hypothetical protein
VTEREFATKLVQRQRKELDEMARRHAKIVEEQTIMQKEVHLRMEVSARAVTLRLSYEAC